MAVTFIQEKKKQKKLLLVFVATVALIVIVLARGLATKLSSVSFSGETVVPTFKKPQIDFAILESKVLKDLEPFKEINPFEGKAGRGNPFTPY